MDKKIVHKKGCSKCPECGGDMEFRAWCGGWGLAQGYFEICWNCKKCWDEEGNCTKEDPNNPVPVPKEYRYTVRR